MNVKHPTPSAAERRRMANRRYARSTNAFSRRIRNKRASVALHFVHYNFCRIHPQIRITPAMAAGITTWVWEIEELVERIKVEESRKEPGLRVTTLVMAFFHTDESRYAKVIVLLLRSAQLRSGEQEQTVAALLSQADEEWSQYLDSCMSAETYVARVRDTRRQSKDPTLRANPSAPLRRPL